MEFLPFPADPGFPDPHPYTGRTSAGGTSQGPGKRESAGPGHPTDLGRAEGRPGGIRGQEPDKQAEQDGGGQATAEQSNEQEQATRRLPEMGSCDM